MSDQDFIHHVHRLPLLLRQGQVIKIAKRLQLGQARVRTWLAHGAVRVKVGQQWRYPTVAVVQGMLDMAGLSITIGARTVAAERDITKAAEGAPGFKP